MMDESVETKENPSDDKKRIKPIWLWVFSACLIVTGIISLFFAFYRKYTLVVDDIPYTFKSIALRGRAILKNAGLEIDDADRVSIDINTYSWKLPGEIKINRARKVTILHQSETHQLNSAARHPATLLQLAGIKLYPNDIILQNKQPIDPYAPIPPGQEIIFEYIPAKLVLLNDSGQMRSFSSQAETLEQAFAEQNIQINEHDRLSLPLSTKLSLETQAEIRRARNYRLAWRNALLATVLLTTLKKPCWKSDFPCKISTTSLLQAFWHLKKTIQTPAWTSSRLARVSISSKKKPPTLTPTNWTRTQS